VIEEFVGQRDEILTNDDGQVEERSGGRADSFRIVDVNASLGEDYRICTGGIGRAENGPCVARILDTAHDCQQLRACRQNNVQGPVQEIADSNDALRADCICHGRYNFLGRVPQGDPGGEVGQFGQPFETRIGGEYFNYDAAATGRGIGAVCGQGFADGLRTFG
jgi:hypothetical protein